VSDRPFPSAPTRATPEELERYVDALIRSLNTPADLRLLAYLARDQRWEIQALRSRAEKANVRLLRCQGLVRRWRERYIRVGPTNIDPRTKAFADAADELDEILEGEPLTLRVGETPPAGAPEGQVYWVVP
jgi:hypothetical protein